MTRVCVFCGSSTGRDPDFIESASALVEELSARDLGLVYGGSSIGIMGHLADEAMRRGVEVIGIIPRSLADREIAHRNLTELRIVETLHERKALMADRSSAFVALPGGFGTLDELFEVLTWRQLGVIDKPIGLLNVKGYYKGLLDFIEHAQESRFVPPTWTDLIVVDSEPASLLTKLLPHRP